MFTAGQLVCHLVGDYLLQTNWQAQQKKNSIFVALYHALLYSIPFVVFLEPSFVAFWVILVSHALIDRYSLARYVIWLKEMLPPIERYRITLKQTPAPPLTSTGYPDTMPAYLSTFLTIVTDNLLHILINGAALYYL